MVRPRAMTELGPSARALHESGECPHGSFARDWLLLLSGGSAAGSVLVKYGRGRAEHGDPANLIPDDLRDSHVAVRQAARGSSTAQGMMRMRG